ncbi:MAG: hypothetical protein JNK82_07810 [Myxococcaceae bacterium]|nr:hypothetical protein [Myxococcaceae bacterium]
MTFGGFSPAELSKLSKASLKDVQQALLGPTLEHAATQIPYYRERWGNRWRRVRTVEDLPRLPLLEKPDAIEQQEKLGGPQAHRYVGIISSGTSHGERRPLRVARSDEELEALDVYRRARYAPPPDADRAPAEPSREVVLEVRSMQHGLPEHPAPPHLLRIPFSFTANGFRLFRELVSRPLADGRKVTGIIAGLGAIKPLTAHLLESGLDPSDFGVTEIGINGYRITTHWRQVLERAWGAEVFDVFSLSEFATPALECKACGYNHWQDPPLIVEVLDAFTHRPITKGTGLMALTGLYPFVQAFPLIRYFTGDLVEIGPDCPRGGRGVLCRGRASQCLLKKGAPLLVSPMDVEEFLDGTPDASRDVHPVQTLGLIRSPDTGLPRFELHAGPKAPRVVVELRYDPHVFPERAGEVAAGLTKFLRSKSRALKALDVQLVGPGVLKGKRSKY